MFQGGPVSAKVALLVLGGGIIAFLALALWATAGRGGLFPEGWWRTGAAATAHPEGYVSGQLIQPWPFSVPDGVLSCDSGKITLTSQGKTYALNGWAHDSGNYLDISQIWNRERPIDAVLDTGKALCK